MTNKHIHEIELNTSNLCGANCIFCSRPHGVGDTFFMEPDTFAVLVEQLKDIDFDIIQTSGNGETFLNPHYLDYVRTLKREFPDKPRWIYNNFSMMTKERADAIVNERLFDRVHVTIDSLVPWVYERSKRLNFERTMKNLEYFISINDAVPLVILYNDIKLYYARVAEWGLRPANDNFTDAELEQVTDELEDMRERFGTRDNVTVCQVNPCLWGERGQAVKDPKTPCPKLDIIENVTWVLPSGNVTACCYDDNQDAFICGNIHDEHLLDIFNGEKRREFIEGIKARKYTDYPCTSPGMCIFGGEGPEKCG
jgi:sulfatase maturation enzyme AslB (radical SAM superfamily)